MRIYLENILSRFHSDLSWNDGALGFFEDVVKQEAEEEEQE